MLFIFLLFRSSWSFGHPLDLILVHFGRLWGPIGPSWVLPGVPQGALGVPLGSPWAHLGPSWAHLDPSWTHPGLLLAPLGSILLLYGSPSAHLPPIWVPQSPVWLPFGVLLDPFGLFWDHLGVILGSFCHQVGTMWSSCCGDFLTLFLNIF